MSIVSESSYGPGPGGCGPGGGAVARSHQIANRRAGFGCSAYRIVTGDWIRLAEARDRHVLRDQRFQDGIYGARTAERQVEVVYLSAGRVSKSDSAHYNGGGSMRAKKASKLLQNRNVLRFRRRDINCKL